MRRSSPGEVRADPLAQVGRLAHVERHAPPVDEPVDAGRAGERGGQAELGGLGVAGQPGQDEEVVQPEHAPARRPLEQQVEQIGRGQRVLQRPVGRAVVEPEAVGQGAQAAVRHLVAHEPPGQRRGVDGAGWRSRAQPSRAEGGVEEAEVEADVVPDDDRAAEELGQRRQHGVRCGARGATIASVMPVSTVMAGGMAQPGLTERVEGAQALAAPDLDGADLRDGILVGRAAGGLQVHDGERHLGRAGCRARRTTVARPGTVANRCSFRKHRGRRRCPSGSARRGRPVGTMTRLDVPDDLLRPGLEVAFVVAVVGARQRPPIPPPPRCGLPAVPEAAVRRAGARPQGGRGGRRVPGPGGGRGHRGDRRPGRRGCGCTARRAGRPSWRRCVRGGAPSRPPSQRSSQGGPAAAVEATEAKARRQSAELAVAPDRGGRGPRPPEQGGGRGGQGRGPRRRSWSGRGQPARQRYRAGGGRSWPRRGGRRGGRAARPRSRARRAASALVGARAGHREADACAPSDGDRPAAPGRAARTRSILHAGVRAGAAARPTPPPVRRRPAAPGARQRPRWRPSEARPRPRPRWPRRCRPRRLARPAPSTASRPTSAVAAGGRRRPRRRPVRRSTDAHPPRRRALRIPRGMHVGTPEADAWLLTEAEAAVVVDGYNVAKLGWPDAVLVDQRERLLDVLDDLAARYGTTVEVVFDGADVGPGRARPAAAGWPCGSRRPSVLGGRRHPGARGRLPAHGPHRRRHQRPGRRPRRPRRGSQRRVSSDGLLAVARR